MVSIPDRHIIHQIARDCFVVYCLSWLQVLHQIPTTTIIPSIILFLFNNETTKYGNVGHHQPLAAVTFDRWLHLAIVSWQFLMFSSSVTSWTDPKSR